MHQCRIYGWTQPILAYTISSSFSIFFMRKFLPFRAQLFRSLRSHKAFMTFDYFLVTAVFFGFLYRFSISFTYGKNKIVSWGQTYKLKISKVSFYLSMVPLCDASNIIMWPAAMRIRVEKCWKYTRSTKEELLN